MEKPDLRIKNIIVNSLVVFYWTFIYFGSLYWGVKSGLINSFLSIVIQALVFLLLAWPIKMYWIDIYIDALVFKEQGCHPLLKSDFCVALDNIYDYKIARITLNLYWVILRRENGKTIRRIISMSEDNFNYLSNKIAEKIKQNENNASA